MQLSTGIIMPAPSKYSLLVKCRFEVPEKERTLYAQVGIGADEDAVPTRTPFDLLLTVTNLGAARFPGGELKNLRIAGEGYSISVPPAITLEIPPIESGGKFEVEPRRFSLALPGLYWIHFTVSATDSLEVVLSRRHDDPGAAEFFYAVTGVDRESLLTAGLLMGLVTSGSSGGGGV
jgi:hypothetical protein